LKIYFKKSKQPTPMKVLRHEEQHPVLSLFKDCGKRIIGHSAQLKN
jgi:hypothetical protein